ncbi:MAG: phosphoesterase, partial [Solirubrobacterales bacterium]
MPTVKEMIEKYTTCVAALILSAVAGLCDARDYSGSEPVGQIGPQRYVTPIHQILTPAGVQVELPGMRPQAAALSPDGRLLATSGKTQQLVLIDPRNGEIRQRIALPSREAANPNDVSSHILKPDTSGQLSFTGLVFSPDGSRIYLSNVNGDIKVFSIDGEGRASGLLPISLPLANAPTRKEEIPAGLAITRDGGRL